MVNTKFQKGHRRVPGSGRAKGTLNGDNALIKAAMVEAATLEGENGSGRDGLVGFFRDSLRVQRGTFLQGLFKLLPKQIDVHQEGNITIQIITGVPERALIKDAEVIEGGNGKRKELS